MYTQIRNKDGDQMKGGAWIWTNFYNKIINHAS